MSMPLYSGFIDLSLPDSDSDSENKKNKYFDRYSHKKIEKKLFDSFTIEEKHNNKEEYEENKYSSTDDAGEQEEEVIAKTTIYPYPDTSKSEPRRGWSIMGFLQDLDRVNRNILKEEGKNVDEMSSCRCCGCLIDGEDNDAGETKDNNSDSDSDSDSDDAGEQEEDKYNEDIINDLSEEEAVTINQCAENGCLDKLKVLVEIHIKFNNKIICF